MKPNARHVVFEAAGGYTANVCLREALAPNASSPTATKATLYPGPTVRRFARSYLTCTSGRAQVAHRHPLYRRRSAGLLGGRGYNNHADPWKEERYA